MFLASQQLTGIKITRRSGDQIEKGVPIAKGQDTVIFEGLALVSGTGRSTQQPANKNGLDTSIDYAVTIGLNENPFFNDFPVQDFENIRIEFNLNKRGKAEAFDDSSDVVTGNVVQIYRPRAITLKRIVFYIVIV